MHLAFLLACQADKGSAPAGGDTGPAQGELVGFPAIVARAEVTWTVEFDAAAEAGGLQDCSYTRVFEGVQYLDMGYLCPECDVQVRGTATMTDGLDCYAQIASDLGSERTELWGWSEDAFFRSGLDQYPLDELASFEDAGEGVETRLAWVNDEAPVGGGSMRNSAAGTLSYATDPGILLSDPWSGSPEEYACGWGSEDPGDLELSYDLEIGATFPNVRLQDQCGEMLSLWDLYGSWLVIDASQADSESSQLLAAGAEAFKAQMAAEGYDVEVVSLLGDGLGDPGGTPDEATLTAWVDAHGLTGPVLYDRGFAFALFPGFIAEQEGSLIGFPGWVLVDPQMRLVHGQYGFDSWDDAAGVIRASAL